MVILCCNLGPELNLGHELSPFLYHPGYLGQLEVHLATSSSPCLGASHTFICLRVWPIESLGSPYQD